MKILAVITLEPSAEAFISDQLSYLQEKLGCECHLICSEHVNLDSFAKRHKIKYKAISLSRQISPINWVRNFFVILRYMKEHKFDVLIAHSFPSACLLSMTAGKIIGIPHRIEIAHGALQEGLSGLRKRLVIASETHNSRLSEVVVSVSPSVCKRRFFDKIDKPEKQRLLSKGTSNGVDTVGKFNPNNVPLDNIETLRQKFGFCSNDFIIGFCGRLVHDKGITELVDGVRLLLERHPEKSIKLLIVGEPEIRDALPQSTIDYIKNSRDIIFTGRVPYETIQQYYLLMDVFILPSYREGFPTVVLEASAMERPVVTTRKTGCIDSIVEGETGAFCDIDAESIANAVEPFFDKDYACKIGENGRKWVVDNFEHSIVREAMLNLINELTLKHK